MRENVDLRTVMRDIRSQKKKGKREIKSGIHLRNSHEEKGGKKHKKVRQRNREGWRTSERKKGKMEDREQGET